MHNNAISELDRAVAGLCISAIFFCMRSCEYSKVSNQEDRKTKLLCLRNIFFFKETEQVHHDSPNLESSSLTSITFEDQKNRVNNYSINLHKSSDSLLCPVKAWKKTVKQIWSYTDTSKDTPVNEFRWKNKKYSISNANITNALRTSVATMQDQYLGFT